VELSDAVTKAADMVVMPQFAVSMTPAGPRFIETPFANGDSSKYEYLAELKPLMSKWGDIVGERILEAAKANYQFEDDDLTDAQAQATQEAFDAVYNSTGVDVAVGVFSLGYLLGDPKWDKQPHDRKTFHQALKEDIETQKVLTARFKGEGFLRERFSSFISLGAGIMSDMFRRTNVPHNEKNVHEWGKLSVTVCFFEAFQIGLKARRIWEEDATFDQIARGLED
jgi:hypothetical protein